MGSEHLVFDGIHRFIIDKQFFECFLGCLMIKICNALHSLFADKDSRSIRETQTW